MFIFNQVISLLYILGGLENHEIRMMKYAIAINIYHFPINTLYIEKIKVVVYYSDIKVESHNAAISKNLWLLEKSFTCKKVLICCHEKKLLATCQRKVFWIWRFFELASSLSQ